MTAYLQFTHKQDKADNKASWKNKKTKEIKYPSKIAKASTLAQTAYFKRAKKQEQQEK